MIPMEYLREILDRGFKIEIKKHEQADYEENPELLELDAFRINLVKDGKYYAFDAEYKEPYADGFREIFEEILTYVDTLEQ